MDNHLLHLSAEGIQERVALFVASCYEKLPDTEAKLIEKATKKLIHIYEKHATNTAFPSIIHVLLVAEVVLKEMKLGASSILGALFHNLSEKSPLDVEDIKKEFGEDIGKIITGFARIDKLQANHVSSQAENLRSLLLILADDIRAVLIEIAHRLVKIRELDKHDTSFRHKYATETLYLFAPLAHRLGLYRVKSELEDLSLKYLHPEAYLHIQQRLEETSDERNLIIHNFTAPIIAQLIEKGLSYTIKGRTKSIYSIWNKMNKQQVRFEQVYDLFAIRIILDSKLEDEKADCWKAYSIVTDIYNPSPSRLRDWLSVPKNNGYESLHTTVMGPDGKWIEVQIRTQRMHDIAENGLAAHWVYKEGGEKKEKGLDNWLSETRAILDNPTLNASEAIDNFRLSLYDEEIFVFTPKGDLKKLPAGATVLDFAYHIHTNVGHSCTGAKVNNKIMPIKAVLNNGDQVEILTSKTQKPHRDWVNIVVSTSAKARIRKYLIDEQYKDADSGKDSLARKLKSWKIDFTEETTKQILDAFKLSKVKDLYCAIAREEIGTAEIKALFFPPVIAEKTDLPTSSGEKNISWVLNEKAQGDLIFENAPVGNLVHHFAECCKPLHGDEIFGFVTITKGISIHRKNCPNATQMLSRYGYRHINARWREDLHDFPNKATLSITATDRSGFVSEISHLLTIDKKVNMLAISFQANAGIIQGTIKISLAEKSYLSSIIEKIRKVDGVQQVV